MTEISHSKARSLLQAAADRSLEPAERSALEAHLQDCKECRVYHAHLADLEANLRQTLHGKWDGLRPELDLPAIHHPSLGRLIWNNLSNQTPALGKATVMIALLLGYVVISNLVGARLPISNDETPTALPTPNGFTLRAAISPTAQVQSALTGLTTVQGCKTVIYIVKPGDTLESIAVQHRLTKEIILAYNPAETSLAMNTVLTGMELAIPVCQSTPSRTAGVPGGTLTITPLNGTIIPGQHE